MTRRWLAPMLAACLSGSIWAAPYQQAQDSKDSQEGKVQEPPEEDEGLRAPDYAFNPLQASKEVQVGDFYFKKGSWKAAAGRYREAVKWNPGFTEAYLKLGETLEKMDSKADAKKAYEKFLELNKDDKKAEEIRKHIKQL